jgi:hypothetical protein
MDLCSFVLGAVGALWASNSCDWVVGLGSVGECNMVLPNTQ